MLGVNYTEGPRASKCLYEFIKNYYKILSSALQDLTKTNKNFSTFEFKRTPKSNK